MAGLVNIDLGQIIAGVGSAAKDLRTAITGEIPAEKRAELEAKVQELEAAAMQAQTAVNETEARSTSLFIAGWRPFIGWVCGAALAYEFLIRPFLVAFGAAAPKLEMQDLGSILLGMLGLGYYRTKEKLANAVDRH
jgi:hypothetical protein